MWDTICHLPVPSDVISLAIHPTEPIFAIGLASGHVRAIRLPDPHTTTIPPEPSSNGTSPIAAQQPRRSSLTRTSVSPSPTTGYGTLDTLWHTRRHKGSARALAFSTDGSTLFSAGTDGLLKAAHAMSGRVLGKVALAADPSALCALNAETLLVGDDAGALHTYTLSRETRTADGLDALVPRPSPDSTTHPHASADDPGAGSEPISSITALPPTKSSTSGAARAWITTSAGTLAASDKYKGLVRVSAEQGGASGEELLASACVPTTLPNHDNTPDSASDNATVLTCDSAGLVALFPRTAGWTDRATATRIAPPPAQTPGIAALRADADGPVDTSAECIAVRCGSGSRSGSGSAGPDRDDSPLVAIGLASGAVRFAHVRAHAGRRAGREAGVRAQVLAQAQAVQHDERGLDGVTCVGFDVCGRLVSAGGALVKVWMEIGRAALRDCGVDGADPDDDDESDEDDQDEDDEEDEDESDESGDEGNDSDDETPRRRKRRRRETTRTGKLKRGAVGGAGHGIGLVAGLD